MITLAPLIEAERSRLANMLGTASFDVVEHRAGHCSIPTRDVIVHIHRRPQADFIDSSVELRTPPTHSVRLSDTVHTWMILRSHGEPWPTALPDGEMPKLLSDELDRLARALQILGNEETLLEALLWEAGYREGYLAWG